MTSKQFSKIDEEQFSDTDDNPYAIPLDDPRRLTLGELDFLEREWELAAYAYCRWDSPAGNEDY